MSISVRASIIVPNWNGRDMLLHALRSLSAQTFTDFEIIVVDNGSADGSCAALSAEFPHVRVIALPENRGFAPAVNEGVRAAAGSVVVMMNNDTEAEPEWLERLVAALDAHSDAGSAMSKMLDYRDRMMIDSVGLQLGLFASNIGEGQPDGPDYAEPRRIFGACGGAAAYRRAALAEVGLLDETLFAYAEDVDLAARLQLAGWSCIYEPRAVIYHRGSATTRRLPGLRFYLLMRNSITIFLRYASPRRLLWTPLVLLWPFVRGVIDRQPPAVPLRAVLAALRSLPDILRRRRELKQKRTIGHEAFDALLASPLTRAGRKPARRTRLGADHGDVRYTPRRGRGDARNGGRDGAARAR
jgi:GT2 family glycosyltransferase